MKKFTLPLAVVMVFLIIALGFMGVPPWLAVLVGMIIIARPFIILAVKADRMLGIHFSRKHGLPKVEVI